ncbi:hypothetical protein ABVK25_009314 [Lepraria finkii]|uniref:Uncharacterized protein n=1 Tax=Lepraria finkii TaxID=1340010 RepID=A0ABR4AXU9_9LECA
MEVFPPGTPTKHKNLMFLRIRGEIPTAVAEEKGTLEKILTGDAAMDGDIKIWDVLFTTPEGDFFLKQLALPWKACVLRDTRKHQLCLYGSERRNRVMLNSLLDNMDKLREDAPKLTLRTLKAAQEALGASQKSLDRRKSGLTFRRTHFRKLPSR